MKNPFITKTIKIRVFNAMALRDISTLYHWKGESGWKDKRNMPDPEDDQVIGLTYLFFIMLKVN